MTILLLAAMTGAAGAVPSAADGIIAYLALGDSYTIGEGVAAGRAWPDQLARLLRDDGIGVDDPRIIATTGWTTDELDTAIDAAAPLGDYGFVSLLIGVNNQYRGLPLDAYREGFDTLLQRAIGFAGGRSERVLVLSIPDWGATAFGHASGRDLAQVARELDAYNAAARALCDARGVAFVDITTISRARGAEPAMLAEDGLHPSAAMHAQWAQIALPVARHLLDSR